jgi:aminoglycoside phosphotransferase family enzyme
MSSVVHPASASHSTLETLSAAPLSDKSYGIPLRASSAPCCYQIEDTRLSECALILFAQDTTASKRVVMKLLRDYADTRYSLDTLERRQQCQLEALERNKIFTPDVYQGLARADYFDLPQGTFPVSEIIKNPMPAGISHLDLCNGYIYANPIIEKPTGETLDPGAEYALIMNELPQNRRLDHLLFQESKLSLQHIRLLTRHIAHVHELLGPTTFSADGPQWGSYEQLRKKLMHNFGLLDLVLTANGHGRTSNWSEETLARFQETLGRLKKVLICAFMQSCYYNHFEQRAKEQRIRCCHGDLKSPNIWILPSDQENGGKDAVKILDAIDFNPAYSNIDTLSDFAMLVIDVQTRTGSALLANEMIEYYLSLTEQESEVAKSVLNYYLVEKAIVGAAISIVYDDAPDLGLSLLKVAEMRLNCLIDRRH